MKRCPQCEFIYENDQSLCDMDGRELVYERGALILPENAVPPERTAKSRWRSFAILPTGGVALGAALFLFDSAPTRHPTPESGARPSVEVAAAPQPAPNTVPAPPVVAVAPPARPPIIKVRATVRATAAASPSPPPAPSPVAKREEKKSKPENETGKKGSKLGSILKKTGRILKKPFGF